MFRKTLLLVAVALAVAIVMNPTNVFAQDKLVEIASDMSKGFWGLFVRTPEAVVVDVCSGVANLFSGVAVVLSDMFAIGNRAPAGRYVFDAIISDGLDEVACFMHVSGINAIEIGTRRDFADIPIEREVFIQREPLFHKEAYRTFSYSAKSFALALLDLAAGIPANACRMVGLKGAADSMTKAADDGASALLGTIQWKYKLE
jgi:hypothetical protein